MLFQTPEFLILLTITVAAYILPLRGHRLAVLGISSLLFYAASGIFDFALFLVVLSVTYVLSTQIRPRGPIWPLALSLVLLFGNLAWFKYPAFLAGNADWILSRLGLPVISARARSYLPLGISFYTFQIAAYLVDMRRGTSTPARHFGEYLTFFMFFAQLIAGPILRARDFLPELQARRTPTLDNLKAAIFYIGLGLVKKVVLADSLAPFVDQQFATWATLSHAQVWIAAWVFAFQIYFDFSGYSDIAVGLGRLFGMDLMANFRTPYLAASPTEFWRRWHISLSTWFRDYVFIPLGGSRRAGARPYVNFLFTMTISGLWHGASWTFVIWGAMQGVMLVVDKLTRRVWPAYDRHRRWSAIGWLITFQTVTLGWLFFRSPTLHVAWQLFLRALDLRQLGTWAGQGLPLLLCVTLLLLHLGEEWLVRNRRSLGAAWGRMPSPVRGLSYASLAVLIVYALAVPSRAAFIYFRF
jgi:alginate O-acetyltransferase complex protein AlgI